jgi:two-component system sensor histidine kinase GlrK
MAAVTLYPRSFLRMILLGWLLATLPLLAAIAFASLSLSGITQRSDAVMHQSAQTARLGWELPEQLTHMERSLRQYEVLGDTTLRDDYALARKSWRQGCREFAQIPQLASLAGGIEEMLQKEEAAYQQWTTAYEVAPLLATVGDIRYKTFSLLEEAGHSIDNERAAFRSRADDLRQQLLIALILAISLAGAMFWYGRRVLGRLLSRFERAVVVLGQNRLDRRIQLKGPEDMQWVGERLEWLRRRLRLLEQQRTRILRHVSHELKTPLAALREGSSLLNDGVAGTLSPQQAKIAGIMQSNVLRLQALIDSLLKMQQAGFAREHLEMQPLRLDQILQQNLETHMLAARDKRLRLSGSLAPLTVDGGREELTTIVNNLLSNAIILARRRGRAGAPEP